MLDVFRSPGCTSLTRNSEVMTDFVSKRIDQESENREKTLPSFNPVSGEWVECLTTDLTRVFPMNATKTQLVCKISTQNRFNQ